MIIRTLFFIIACHAVGDYFLQSDFLARTKGENFWHMLMHCVLYSVPYAFIFGIDYRLLIVFLTHIIIDLLKARFKLINYVADQVLHISISIALYAVIPLV